MTLDTLDTYLGAMASNQDDGSLLQIKGVKGVKVNKGPLRPCIQTNILFELIQFIYFPIISTLPPLSTLSSLSKYTVDS